MAIITGNVIRLVIYLILTHIRPIVECKIVASTLNIFSKSVALETVAPLRVESFPTLDAVVVWLIHHRTYEVIETVGDYRSVCYHHQ
jgi:hypothetical protein